MRVNIEKVMSRGERLDEFNLAEGGIGYGRDLEPASLSSSLQFDIADVSQ